MSEGSIPDTQTLVLDAERFFAVVNGILEENRPLDAEANVAINMVLRGQIGDLGNVFGVVSLAHNLLARSHEAGVSPDRAFVLGVMVKELLAKALPVIDLAAVETGAPIFNGRSGLIPTLN